MKPVGGSITLRHPWSLQQLELLQGTDFTNPYCQRFAQTYVIGTVQSGTGVVQYRNTRNEIAAGALYVLEPGETWKCKSNDLTFHHLLVEPALLQRVAAEISDCEKPWPHFPSHDLVDASLSLTLHDLYTRSIASVTYLQQQELLLQTLAQLLLSHAEDPGEPSRLGWERPAVKRIKAYLEEYYAEDISLEDLSSVAGLSAFHLTRIFRQAVGLPPHAYQIQLRISRARALLAQGFSVNSVAHETGFFDQTHFTNQFKRHIGVTPGTYRKTARFY